MAASSMRCAVSAGLVPCPSFRGDCNSSCSTASGSSSCRPLRQGTMSFSPALSPALSRTPALSSVSCQASSEKKKPATENAKKSILCTNCEGNGAVVCSQCKGEGLNAQDYFQGRFKAGTVCWLCNGSKQMLCGNCNGAGFMGGFLNTQDE